MKINLFTPAVRLLLFTSFYLQFIILFSTHKRTSKKNVYSPI